MGKTVAQAMFWKSSLFEAFQLKFGDTGAAWVS